jgi:hypothetical protein
LQQFRRGLAHPQRDALLVQRQVRGVVIGIFQALGRAGFDTRGDQGMYPDAADVVGSAVELQFDFGSHGAAREMRMPPSLSKPPFRLYLAAAYFLPPPTVIDGEARGCKRRLATAESGQQNKKLRPGCYSISKKCTINSNINKPAILPCRAPFSSSMTTGTT